MILSNSGSTPVVPKRTAEVDPELFLRLKHGVIVDIDSTVLHLEPRAQERCGEDEVPDGKIILCITQWATGVKEENCTFFLVSCRILII